MYTTCTFPGKGKSVVPFILPPQPQGKEPRGTFRSESVEWKRGGKKLGRV